MKTKIPGNNNKKKETPRAEGSKKREMNKNRHNGKYTVKVLLLVSQN